MFLGTLLRFYCCLVNSYLILLQFHRLQPAMLLCLWDFPGKNTGVCCHFLLQGIFPNQGSNLHLLPWQVGSLPLSHQGSPGNNLNSVLNQVTYLCFF